MKFDVRSLKVALVHDYLNQYGGAERVLESLHRLFPQAPVYTLLYQPENLPDRFHGWDIRPSYLNRLPGHRTHYQMMLPLFPGAVEGFDLNGYDIVISSSNAWAKGVITSVRTFHLCYIHTPMRFAWDWYHQIPREHDRATNLMLLPMLSLVRQWDVLSSLRPDSYVANSVEVQRRLKKYYKVDSEVIYPSVDTEYFCPASDMSAGDYYLMVARLKPYKRVELAIEAFNRNRQSLIIVGQGSEYRRLKKMAGPNIKFAGWVTDQELREYYRNSRALIFTALEDFGIAPVEAQSCGRPVIAFGQGGCLETVKAGYTGILFREQTAESLLQAIDEFQKWDYHPEKIRAHALKFGHHLFDQKLMQCLEREYSLFKQRGF